MLYKGALYGKKANWGRGVQGRPGLIFPGQRRERDSPVGARRTLENVSPPSVHKEEAKEPGDLSRIARSPWQNLVGSPDSWHPGSGSEFCTRTSGLEWPVEVQAARQVWGIS